MIALILRDAAERHAPATLIAADGNLIRRVNAALDRWHLRPDESAGQPLTLTAPGLFLRQVAALFGQKLGLDALLVLLKQPVTATGSAPGATPADIAWLKLEVISHRDRKSVV